MAVLFRPFGLLLPNNLKLFGFQYFDIERIWLRLCQRRVCTINWYLCFYFYYVFRYCCQYFFSEKFQNLQRTNDEQNEKISEYERQKLENEGRIFLKKQKLQNTISNTTHNTYKFLVVIPVKWYRSQVEV